MDPFDLQRFVDAQADVYEDVLAELRRGRKSSHWMWFVFPQLAGLGRSPTAQHFAIGSLSEARAFLAHPLLGPRLRQCASLLLNAAPGTAEDIFGPIDALKLRSSMTLFVRADGVESVFRDVLDRFFDGEPDPRSDALLEASRRYPQPA